MFLGFHISLNSRLKILLFGLLVIVISSVVKSYHECIITSCISSPVADKKPTGQVKRFLNLTGQLNSFQNYTGQVKNCSKCHRAGQHFFKNVTGQVKFFQNFTGQGQILKIITGQGHRANFTGKLIQDDSLTFVLQILLKLKMIFLCFDLSD